MVHAALRQGACALGERAFGDERHFQVPGQEQGDGLARRAAAEDQNIVSFAHNGTPRTWKPAQYSTHEFVITRKAGIWIFIELPANILVHAIMA